MGDIKAIIAELENLKQTITSEKQRTKVFNIIKMWDKVLKCLHDDCRIIVEEYRGHAIGDFVEVFPTIEINENTTVKELNEMMKTRIKTDITPFIKRTAEMLRDVSDNIYNSFRTLSYIVEQVETILKSKEEKVEETQEDDKISKMLDEIKETISKYIG